MLEDGPCDLESAIREELGSELLRTLVNKGSAATGVSCCRGLEELFRLLGLVRAVQLAHTLQQLAPPAHACCHACFLHWVLGCGWGTRSSTSSSFEGT